MKPAALVLAIGLGSPLVHADAPESSPRGPAPIRDGQLLAQPRLTLPAASPFTARRGAWEIQLSGLWANSFSWRQDRAGENGAASNQEAVRHVSFPFTLTKWFKNP